MADKKAVARMTHAEEKRRRARVQEHMKEPINQFMNMQGEKEGEFKYPLGRRLEAYFLANPDPALNAMRLSNALLHEIRFHQDQSKIFYDASLETGAINIRDEKGSVMNKRQCYTTYIKEVQLIHTVLSTLREQITAKLLSTVDGEIFSHDQFNEYVCDVEIKVKELGYTLFPKTVDVIKPL